MKFLQLVSLSDYICVDFILLDPVIPEIQLQTYCCIPGLDDLTLKLIIRLCHRSSASLVTDQLELEIA